MQPSQPMCVRRGDIVNNTRQGVHCVEAGTTSCKHINHGAAGRRSEHARQRSDTLNPSKRQQEKDSSITAMESKVIDAGASPCSYYPTDEDVAVTLTYLATASSERQRMQGESCRRT
jgi:hypothetical protein